MKTLRIVGALFWLGCGWCAGDAACRNARRHLEALEETLLLLQRVRQEIDYRRTDLTLLFRRLEREGAVRGESFQALCPPPGLTRSGTAISSAFRALDGRRPGRNASG